MDGTINYIMVRGIGQAFVTADVDADIVKTVLKQALVSR